MFHKTVLKNGLRIIVVPLENNQAVTVLALVKTGSKYETKETSGISHFLEHMYFKGTKKRPDKLEIAETLDRVGGLYNAFTGQDSTGFFAKVSASRFELALDWISDIFLNSLLPEKEIKKEKTVIIEEINMYRDMPMAHVQTLWNRLLYGDQPAGWDVVGTKESILNMGQKDLRNYMESQYRARETVVAVAGKVDSDFAFKKIKHYFSGIPSGQGLEKPKVTEPQSSPSCGLETRQTDQTHLCIGARGLNLFHPQRYVQEILSLILGGSGMMSSRLFIEVREKLGLAYYIKTESVSDPDTGCVVSQAGVDNQKAEKAILAILKEYKKISTEKVPEKELRKAKDYYKGKLDLDLETSDAQAFFYAEQEILEEKILTPEEISEKIDKITADDILKLARDIFRSEKLNLALIGPFEDEAKFQKILKL